LLPAEIDPRVASRPSVVVNFEQIKNALEDVHQLAQTWRFEEPQRREAVQQRIRSSIFVNDPSKKSAIVA
jgi:hypothetical protein